MACCGPWIYDIETIYHIFAFELLLYSNIRVWRERGRISQCRLILVLRIIALRRPVAVCRVCDKTLRASPAPQIRKTMKKKSASLLQWRKTASSSTIFVCTLRSYFSTPLVSHGIEAIKEVAKLLQELAKVVIFEVYRTMLQLF